MGGDQLLKLSENKFNISHKNSNKGVCVPIII